MFYSLRKTFYKSSPTHFFIELTRYELIIVGQCIYVSKMAVGVESLLFHVD